MVNWESLQINVRYLTTEDTKWNLTVKVYLSIYFLCVLFCYMLIFFFSFMGFTFCLFKFRDFLTIAINAKLKTCEINYQ